MKNVFQRSPWRESECAFEVAPSEIVSCTPCVRPSNNNSTSMIQDNWLALLTFQGSFIK